MVVFIHLVVVQKENSRSITSTKLQLQVATTQKRRERQLQPQNRMIEKVDMNEKRQGEEEES